jgi:hypothetical protein
LIKSFALENLLLWLAVEEYKKLWQSLAAKAEEDAVTELTRPANDEDDGQLVKVSYPSFNIEQ